VIDVVFIELFFCHARKVDGVIQPNEGWDECPEEKDAKNTSTWTREVKILAAIASKKECQKRRD